MPSSPTSSGRSSPVETHNNLFADPPDFYPPTPPPTTQTYTCSATTTSATSTITLHLVGHSPTEAHHLWNGARVAAAYFEAAPDATVRGRAVLELGAGAGLPSIVAARLGARRVVATDYPDPDVLRTLARNVDEACAGGAGVVVTQGHVWGQDVAPLLAALEEEEGEGRFDVLVLADLLFRHSEHGNMLKTVRGTLAADGTAYVFFTSYRPWLQHKDLAFFDLAREWGFVVEKVLEKKMERAMFEHDPGDEEVRKTCTGWVLRWPREGEAVERRNEGQ